MSCVAVLKAACQKELTSLANTINGEMKGIVGGHSRSGAAVGAIHIEMGSASAFVGGTEGVGTLHLYFLNEGNGGKMIYPKHAKALRYSDGSFHGRSRPYKGIHFVEAIAARHGG